MDRSHGHAGAEVRIFTGAFDHAPPARVAHQIEHRRKSPVDAFARSLSRDGAQSPLHQVGIEAGGVTVRDGKDGAVAIDDIAAVEDWDAQTGFLDGDALNLIQLLNLERRSAAVACPGGLGEDSRAPFAGTDTVEVGTTILLVVRHANLAELTDFFLTGHTGQEIGNPLGQRARSVPENARNHFANSG